MRFFGRPFRGRIGFVETTPGGSSTSIVPFLKVYRSCTAKEKGIVNPLHKYGKYQSPLAIVISVGSNTSFQKSSSILSVRGASSFYSHQYIFQEGSDPSSFNGSWS